LSASFTPGPWRWELDREETVTSLRAGDLEVCNFGAYYGYESSAGDVPNEADKRLIVKAPEMYDALKASWELLEELRTNLCERLGCQRFADTRRDLIETAIQISNIVYSIEGEVTVSFGDHPQDIGAD